MPTKNATPVTPAMSARDASEAYIAATSKRERDAIAEYVAAKAKASKRARWANLHRAIESGDTARIEARITGDWSEVNAPIAKARKAPARKAPAKAAAKPAARKAPARKATPKPAAKPAAKAPAKAPASLDALAEQFAALDEAAFVGFVNAMLKARAK